MKKGESKAPTQRQLRVGEELRHAVAWVLERGHIRDPDLTGVAVTVTEIRVSPDLRYATAFVMPLGGGALETVVAALNRAAPFIRRQVAKSVKLKYTPGFNFIGDQSFDAAGRIDDLLKDPTVARDLVSRPDEEDEPENERESDGS